MAGLLWTIICLVFLNIIDLCMTFAELLGLLRVIHAIRSWRNARKIRKLLKQGDDMDVRQFAFQVVLGLLRHAMTASPFIAQIVTDDNLTSISTAIVGVAGFAWSAYRKWKAAH